MFAASEKSRRDPHCKLPETSRAASRSPPESTSRAKWRSESCPGGVQSDFATLKLFLVGGTLSAPAPVHRSTLSHRTLSPFAIPKKPLGRSERLLSVLASLGLRAQLTDFFGGSVIRCRSPKPEINRWPTCMKFLGPPTNSLVPILFCLPQCRRRMYELPRQEFRYRIGFSKRLALGSYACKEDGTSSSDAGTLPGADLAAYTGDEHRAAGGRDPPLPGAVWPAAGGGGEKDHKAAWRLSPPPFRPPARPVRSFPMSLLHTRRPRFERAPVRRIVLTSRDLELLRAVYRHRLLRSPTSSPSREAAGRRRSGASPGSSSITRSRSPRSWRLSRSPAGAAKECA